MPVRPVLRLPNAALKQRCEPVPAADIEAFRSVAADLVDTMHAHPRCFGIAAPQIGALVRVVVVDVTDHPRATSVNGLVVLANPTVVHSHGSEIAREGCLSVPAFTANVRRATQAVIE